MAEVNIHASSVTNFFEKLETAFQRGDADVHRKAVETENVQRLMAQYQAIMGGDLSAVLDSLADDIEMEMAGPTGAPLVGHWHGKAEVAAAIQRNFSLLADQQAELLDLVAQGDTIVLFCKERGRFRPTGKPYLTHWVHIYTYRDGKVARLRGMLDTAALLEAARAD